VRGQDGVKGDFVIRAKAVGGFAVGPVAAGLGDRSQGLAGEKLESVSQALIVELGVGELIKGPQRIWIGGGFEGEEIGEGPIVGESKMRKHPVGIYIRA
jgi:hypothetical protein